MNEKYEIMKIVLPLCMMAVLPSATMSFSALSSFAGVRHAKSVVVTAPAAFMASSTNNKNRAMTMYEASHDPPSSSEYNPWQVLANTEKWISSTLDTMNAGGGVTGQANNPYARKEVSYACETSTDTPMIVANIFRRLKEVRELGEHHGEEEEVRAISMGEAYEPSTLRQTQVVAIPGNPALRESFSVFDELIEAINSARRNARDYVTDIGLEKLDDRLNAEEEDHDWSVSVNCAHLHPKFGELTPEQQLEEMKKEDEEGEVDVNLQDYKEKRLLARRSPYPTLVIEVRAVPPPDFGTATAQPPQMPAPTASKSSSNNDESGISAADIQKLEALFGMSAHVKPDDLSPKEQEDSFYKAIGQEITEVSFSSVTPLNMAQQWIAKNDQLLQTSPTAAFTESTCAHVDEGYQFVFTNLAMLQESAASTEASIAEYPTQRQYLVMPHFLSSSATSFEKFSKEVQKMLSVLPDLKDKAGIETFHPEHVDPQRRSPVPIFVLVWKH